MADPTRASAFGRHAGGLLVDQIVAYWAGDTSYMDEELGDQSTFGYYARFNGPFTVEELRKAAKETDDASDFTSADFRYAAAQKGGAIYSANDQGFITVEWYETAADISRVWDELENAYEDFEEDEDFEEGEDG